MMLSYPYTPKRLDAVREILGFVQDSAEEYRRRGLLLRVGPMPEHVAVEIDPTGLRSILTNILDKSAKYKEKDVGTASLRAEEDGGTFRLFLDDDGPGVPEEALPRLFDVFYRSDPARRDPNRGSGLDLLAIVQKTAARMGGAVRAEDLPGGGLRMILEIPLAESAKGENTDETDLDH